MPQITHILRARRERRLDKQKRSENYYLLAHQSQRHKIISVRQNETGIPAFYHLRIPKQSERSLTLLNIYPSLFFYSILITHAVHQSKKASLSNLPSL